MSETMIERVAKAICVARGEQPDAFTSFESGGMAKNWQLAVAEARAAISVMREPTDEMEEACVAIDLHPEHIEKVGHWYWRAMIQAALDGER